MMALIARDLAWYEVGNERVLGLVALDLTDEDYVSYILGRDAKGRFRAVWLECSIETQDAATELLRTTIAEYALKPAEEFYQGDEGGRKLDFLTPVVPPERQHPIFKTLISARGYSPARALISEMMHYFDDVDGNFVQQFQSDGFNPRFWELYLYALLNELGYGFDREYEAPDFHCQGLLGDFFVEATTINPAEEAPRVDASNQDAYFEHYVPMRYSGALCAKLKMKYWEKPHVIGHPLVLAIQDFHMSDAMAWSNPALVEYLYAIRQVERVGAQDKSEIVSEKVTEYRWGDKTPIAAGFFLLPESENISAVLANPSGTLPKFNRMAFLAGFGDRDIKMIRSGLCYREGSLTPERFYSEIYSPDYSETWCEGVSVYENPNAKIPLPREAFPCAAHHTSRDGRIFCRKPSFHPVGSTTCIVTPKATEANS
ncbi:MAG TPA: hypothetical protein VN777_07395 [Terriglobales bacterium]|nr:hypothetical protein [Terriglobales bacterium]